MNVIKILIKLNNLKDLKKQDSTCLKYIVKNNSIY